MRNKYTDPFLEIASSQFTGCPVLFACISEDPYQLVKFFVLPFYRGRNYWPRKYLFYFHYFFILLFQKIPKPQNLWCRNSPSAYVTTVSGSSEIINHKTINFEIINFAINVLAASLLHFKLHCKSEIPPRCFKFMC